MNPKRFFAQRSYLAATAIVLAGIVVWAVARPNAAIRRSDTRSGSGSSPVVSETASVREEKDVRKPGVDSAPSKSSRRNDIPLEELAARDAYQALSLALAQTDETLRGEYLQAVLRGWAGVDAAAAAAWAATQNIIEHGQALAAVFNGASKQPVAAVSLARSLMTGDPGDARSIGGYLIFSLNKAGAFDLAAGFATDCPVDLHADLLTAAYVGWGEVYPKTAFSSAMELKTPEMRRTAVQAVFGGWARTNPRELTEVAVNFPQGPERTLALTTALRSWIERDPANAAAWISQNKYSPEMVAALEN